MGLLEETLNLDVDAFSMHVLHIGIAVVAFYFVVFPDLQ